MKRQDECRAWLESYRELPGLIGIAIIILVGFIVDWMRWKR